MRTKTWIGMMVVVLALTGAQEGWAKKGGNGGGGGGNGGGGGGGEPPSGSQEIAYAAGGLFEMDADGGNKRAILPRGLRSDADVAWSPDKTKLVVQNVFKREGPGLYIVDRATGDHVKITNTDSPYISKPAWGRCSDGSEWILFEDAGVGPDGRRDIWAVRPDGTGRVNLTNSAIVERALPHGMETRVASRPTWAPITAARGSATSMCTTSARPEAPWRSRAR